jgi:lipid II:glycine glycyltransferase (peptidoglycan interpeptide bridge formation enzyme)
MGATLIIYKEVFMGNKIAYAPRGILFNYEEEADTRELADKLKKVLGKQGFMLLRMDPYVPLTIRDAEGNIMNFNNKGNAIIDNLKKAGFEYKGKNVYFETEKPRWEALVLLQRDIREIFAKLDKHTRNKVRRAINSGIDVVKDESRSINKLYNFVGRREKKPLAYYKTICEKFEDDVDIYYAKINTETFLINSRRSYEKEVEYNESLAARVQDMSLDDRERNTYLNKKMESDKLITSYKNNLLKATDLLKSNPDGIIIAGAMIIKYDNAAYIFTEGMDEDYAYLDPNYLIKWQLICDYNNLGFKYLNLDGIAGEFEGENNYKGLNESKLGFNSTITEYIGEFDIVLNSFTYNWYKKTKK